MWKSDQKYRINYWKSSKIISNYTMQYENKCSQCFKTSFKNLNRKNYLLFILFCSRSNSSKVNALVWCSSFSAAHYWELQSIGLRLANCNISCSLANPNHCKWGVVSDYTNGQMTINKIVVLKSILTYILSLNDGVFSQICSVIRLYYFILITSVNFLYSVN